MKTDLKNKSGNKIMPDLVSEEKKEDPISHNLKLENFELTGDELARTSGLSGVFCKGVQYYDFKDVRFINSNGLANLISLLKSMLKQGIEVQFVNVNKKIKNKIKAMGLDSIINCN